MNKTKLLTTLVITLTIALGGALTQIQQLEEREPEIITVTETVTEYVEVPVVETVTETVVEYVEVPTTVIEYSQDLPACLYDEVTEVNCFWDAQTQGNGEGESFIAYNGVLYRYEG